MSPESILVISIVILSVAAGWSGVVAVRLRDWRILFLTVMFVLMALRSSLALAAGVDAGTPISVELPVLAASLIALLSVVFVERALVRQVAVLNRLRRSQEQYRRLVEDQVDLVCQFEPDGTLTFVNRAYADYFGRTVEELVGTSLFESIPEEGQREVRKHFAAFGQDRKTSVIVHEVVAASGERRWQEWTDHAFVGADGAVVGFQSIGRDITERKTAGDRLRHSEELNRRIIEALPGGIITVDAEGRIIQTNNEGQRILGIPEGRLKGATIADLEPWTIYENGVTCPSDDFPATRCLRDGQKQPPVVLGTLRPSGEITWAIFTAVPITNPDSGQPEGAVLTFLDITDRKVAEDALRDSEANQRALVQAVPDAMFRLTREGFFRDFIPADGFETLFAPEDFLGKSLDALLPEGVANRSMQAIREALRSNQMQEFEYELEMPDGRRQYEARVVPDRTESVLCLVRDITMRRRAQQHREELLVELEAKNTELERFARTVSHDLKSPLITIRGFMEVLEDDRGAVSDRAAQAIDRINNAARLMLHLLDDLLELARVGRLVNPPEEIAFGEVVRSAVDQTAGRIVKNGVKVKIASDMPPVYGDRTRLVQVMQNLIDNAAKFMGHQRRPKIDIGARREGEHVLCWVRDNGSGIAPRNHERIFGVFDRLRREVEGSGIGLALASRIIEVHGGRMWVESEGEGRGSTFYFTLPSDSTKDQGAASAA